MKIAQELRAGSTIKIGNDPFVVLKAEYNKSGRNAAVVKFKMKNLISEIELKGEDLGDALNYLEEEMPLDVVYYESTAVAVELPTFIEREVIYTEPGLRGDTSGKVMKPARINTGFEIQVPLFVEQGEWIKIDTRNNEYVERVKK